MLSRSNTIGLEDLPPQVLEGADAGLLRAASGGSSDDAIDDEGSVWEPMPLVEALKAPERRIILNALEAHDWNRQKTAEALDINRTTLYKKMKAYGLDESRRAG